LAPGSYNVFASWTANRNRATNAPFTISGGAQPITTQENQEVSPNDEQDPQSGVWFEHLASVSVSSGTLTVTLTDNANEYVIADAVWVRTADSASIAIIDEEDAGHRLEGSGWGEGSVVGAYEGDYRWNKKGDGSDKSIWTFSELPSGSYDVFASWTANFNRATNAPFTISGGAQPITTRENQEVSPNDEQDPQSGVWFEHLASVSVSSGTLTVTLSDDANEYVIADAVWVRSALPLLAAGGEVLSARNAAPLAEANLQPIIDEALSRWAQFDLPGELVSRLEHTEFVVADLPGSNLGLAFSDKIYIDCDAAGYGWFIDSTPDEDEEFVALPRRRDLLSIDPRAVDRIDLLTVVSHELGHIAGLVDLDSSTHSLMGGELGTGVRRVVRQLEIDAVFASNDWDAE
jgi:hypothetical protein